MTIQDGFHPEYPNLKTILRDEYGDIFTVPRLDKLTSGIVLFARNTAFHRELSMQFLYHKIIKSYCAIVHGFPIWDQKEISFPIKPIGDRNHRPIISPKQGKKAITLIKCIKKSNLYSYLEINPLTGYTHQIRAHYQQ